VKEISLKNLKEYLKQRSKEELINEISGLFTRFEYVKLKIPLILAGDSMTGLVICITNALKHKISILSTRSALHRKNQKEECRDARFCVSTATLKFLV